MSDGPAKVDEIPLVSREEIEQDAKQRMLTNPSRWLNNFILWLPPASDDEDLNYRNVLKGYEGTFEEYYSESEEELRAHSKAYLSSTPQEFIMHIDDLISEHGIPQDKIRGLIKKRSELLGTVTQEAKNLKSQLMAELYELLFPVYVDLRYRHKYNHYDIEA